MVQFQTPITIADAIERIRDGQYVIPVIQREFVWKTKQIERLFDSLLRQYPVGSFLFWEVKAESLARYPFYEFSIDILQGGDNHKKKVKQPKDSAIAILDGQQRLTAFLIGLVGSYTGKAKSKPEPQRLYLDILHYNEEAGEEDLAYHFRFMTPDELNRASGPGHHWFRVSEIMAMPNAIAIFDYLKAHGLADADGAFDRLEHLRMAIQQTPVINFYLEKRDDLSEVLNVFVRLNRSGTALSYPDLLLSAATLGWKTHEAQTEFKACVERMNQHGFGFTRDRVLKAGMVLADLDDIKFKASNFKTANAIKIESTWPKIRSSLALASSLLEDFGLSEKTLTAENVIIPVAYYLQHSGRNATYRTSMAAQTDRERLRVFVLMSLLKAGFWTGAVDQILLTVRGVIKSKGASEFPLNSILVALEGIKKPLPFSDAELDALLQAKYSQRSTELILSLLYPVSLKDPHHQDHVVPRARLVESNLKRHGLSREEIALALDRRDRLPNLQLLNGHVNQQKSKMWITDFVDAIKPLDKQAHYVHAQDLGKLPADETEFNRFYLRRERVMKERLRKILKP